MLRADKEVRLNASALSSTSSLIVSLRSDSVPDIPITALVDSGSKHCFIESVFIRKHKIPTRQISPIPLRLFDGSVNAIISESVELLVRFPSHDTFSVDFYVTSLDSSCSVVLGHNWLTRYNPLIDWVLGGVRLAFLSEFGFGLLVLSDFWLGFGIIGVSLETSDRRSQ